MGTIQSRKKKDGSESHTATVRFKRDGVVIHAETETFKRKADARLWIKKKESTFSEPGALDAELNKPDDPTLAEAIKLHNDEKVKEHGKTKTQVLATISKSDLGEMQCSKIDSVAIVAYMRSLDSQPQTKGNYLSHLQSVFSVAKAAWGIPLDKQQIEDARVVCTRLGLISRSNQRTRRPTLDELDRILTHFTGGRSGRKDSIPMAAITVFAMFSSRRLAEITRITWADLDIEHSDVLVRDMKHPGEKLGNDERVILPPEDMRVILAQPSPKDGPIFPFNSDSISASFTRACKLLGIEGLDMHDLRHEAISRLFEMGWNIPQTATVSGHRTWTSLKRYSHIRQSGDKYKGWPWLDKLAPLAANG